MDSGGLDKTSSKILTRFAKSEAGRGSAKSTSVLSSNRRVAVKGETWKTSILARFCRTERGGGAAVALRLACLRFMSVALQPAINSAVLRDVLQTSSQAKICSDVNRNVHFLTYPRGVLRRGILGVFHLNYSCFKLIQGLRDLSNWVYLRSTHQATSLFQSI